MYSIEEIEALIAKAPVLKQVLALEPTFWINPNQKEMDAMPHFPINMQDMKKAEDLWERFIPFFIEVFPETRASKGIIESPLTAIPKMQKQLNKNGPHIEGNLFIKCDNALPIAGSIKARGGFFEVLHYAEKLAKENGLLLEGDEYSVFASETFKNFFAQYTIGVGSTGNLGLSIGIMGAALGFAAKVYMSSDAKQWKKDLLREKGAQVIEFEGDFSEAILAGRQETNLNPKGYFVDDENSFDLFLGYTIGALRLARQIKEQNIKVDADHPLFVYSPCGVGGSPGGTAFGLKQIFGDHVHCFFAEPTHSPSVLAGLASGKMSALSVQDLGIDNHTEADGLAVGRPSHFATEISNHIISGIYTLPDDKLFALLAQLWDEESIFLEPSATAGLLGPQQIIAGNYAKNLNLKNGNHIVWATGGDLVPQENRLAFYEKGKGIKSRRLPLK